MGTHNTDAGELRAQRRTKQQPISFTKDNHTNVASGGEPPDDHRSDDDCGGEERQKEKRKDTKNWVIDPAAWEKCIGQDFETQTESLLSDGKLPNQALLNEACLKYKRTNPCVKAICRNICLYIKDKSKSFLDVWAAYPYKKGDTSYGNTIVFVILTDDKEDNEVGNFNTYKRNVTKIITKKENEAIKTKEKEDPPSPHEIKNLETCLKENGRLLMEKHSNLTRVTASWYRSSGYGTDQFSVQRKPCIALYIHVKGYVPIDEEPFRAEIGRYPVDVREGVSILCVGEPHDYHRNVKMGCAICGAKQGNQIFAGTLGAFLEFKDDNNVYAITCAHVLFPGERLKNMIESGNINCKDTNEIVFQPLSNNVRESCGIVEGVVYSQGGNGVPGMEIAVIKMDNERHPDAGTFPNDSDLLEKGFGPDKPLEFFSGRCCAPEHLSYMRSVYKYGCMTKLTMGTCRVIGASVRTRVLTSTSFSIVMHDQIEIESVGNTPFADFGDSGAVVLTYHGTELIAVGILEGKAEMDDVYLMTPISPILKQLTKDANRECRLKPFRTYNQPIIDPRLLDEEGINQKLTKNFEDHKKELDELRQEVRMKFKDQKTEISQELKESLERHGDEIRNQNKELKQQLEVIQNLLQASTRQNTP